MRLLLLITGSLLLGACGDDTRVCFSSGFSSDSSRFCEDAFGRNRPPEASAGRDQEVVSSEIVELDGTGSFDPDGHIASYSWTQRSGEPVTLTHASEPIASFIAPEVEVSTVLEFRLVVTDDDDASDSDQVRVTVRPLEAAALARGIELLKTVHRPRAVTEADCAACWSFLGLWLTARVQAAVSGADPEVDTLLDSLRIVEQLHAEQSPRPRLPLAHQRLFELGLRQVAVFTARRDPATAELAQRQVGTAPGDAGIWTLDAASAYPALAWLDGTATARRHAVELLLREASELRDPVAVASATLLLALPEDSEREVAPTGG